MRYRIGDVDAGFNSAINKVTKENITPSKELKQGAKDKLTSVLDEWPDNLNGRFVKSFAEAVMIAEASRDHYNESLLNDDTIMVFFKCSIVFFNSWTHP